MKPNRIGTFEISDACFSGENQWQGLLDIFKYVVVLRAEHISYKARTEYVGLSELFEDQPEFCEPPRYRLRRAGQDSKEIIAERE